MSYAALVISVIVGVVSALFDPAPREGNPVRKKLSWAGKALLVLSLVSGCLGIYLAWRSSQEAADKARKAGFEATTAKAQQAEMRSKLNEAEIELLGLRQQVDDRTTLMSALMLGHITQKPQAQLRIITNVTATPPAQDESQVSFLTDIFFPDLKVYLPPTGSRRLNFDANFGDLTPSVSNPFDEVASNDWRALVSIDAKTSGVEDTAGVGILGYSGLQEPGNGGRTVVKAHILPPSYTPIAGSKDRYYVVGLGLSISSYYSHPISSAVLFGPRAQGEEVGDLAILLQSAPSDDALKAVNTNLHAKLKLISLWTLVDEASSTCGALLLTAGSASYNSTTHFVTVPFRVGASPGQLLNCKKGYFFSADTFERNE